MKNLANIITIGLCLSLTLAACGTTNTESSSESVSSQVSSTVESSSPSSSSESETSSEIENSSESESSSEPEDQPVYKPVIYLYPTEKTDVSVKLNLNGKFTYTYPVYNNGWNVTAYPDGRITNKPDSTEHYYLFWEGKVAHTWSTEYGYVVEGNKTEEFLVEYLKKVGLTPREYNDFIVFWLPKMQENNYNLISFSTMEEYEPQAKFDISPTPDSVLRIHMVWKGYDTKPAAPKAPSEVTTFERKGFTVVEWGGSGSN